MPFLTFVKVVKLDMKIPPNVRSRAILTTLTLMGAACLTSCRNGSPPEAQIRTDLNRIAESTYLRVIFSQGERFLKLNDVQVKGESRDRETVQVLVVANVETLLDVPQEMHAIEGGFEGWLGPKTRANRKAGSKFNLEVTMVYRRFGEIWKLEDF